MPKPIYTSALNTANFKAASQVLFSEHRFKFGKEKKHLLSKFTLQIIHTTHYTLFIYKLSVNGARNQLGSTVKCQTAVNRVK